MDFTYDIMALYKGNNSSNGIILPSSRDIYFCSKQKELISQYSQARFFLNQTEINEIEHFTNAESEVPLYTGCFYETALIYYNIVVDLSWVLCYTALEYSINQGGVQSQYGTFDSIEDAYDKLRLAENLVIAPTDPTSPLYYLKKVSPAFSNALDLLTDFWKEYVESDIRQDYNFIKHKGKPRYKEISQESNGKLISIKMNSTTLATDSRDISKNISLSDAIPELKKFDEEKLYPYIKELIDMLFSIVNPSPLAQ